MWKCHVWRNSQPSDDLVGRKKSFFIFVDGFNFKHDSLSPLAFLAVHPFVCVHLCGYQHMCGSRSLGAAAFPCLMALKGSAEPERSWGFAVTTLFLIQVSHNPCCWGRAVPGWRLLCCFGAAVAARGWPCCPWLVGRMLPGQAEQL